ncbi:hypothetical protein EON63_08570 [archaeon]|nr:MAG: hypothetical protein EON63_08570 [archaeon]
MGLGGYYQVNLAHTRAYIYKNTYTSTYTYLYRLKSGDKVPADCRIILSEGMKVDQSMITGEAEPVDNQVCVR